ncbi:Uncharacterized protein HZ326_24017 [Fusarium oxysporum f. sp. albedinis]|nr:Uncharacterized protein HZ326_24017 [Fusarium oxysporum f. sp. albedinis]
MMGGLQDILVDLRYQQHPQLNLHHLLKTNMLMQKIPQFLRSGWSNCRPLLNPRLLQFPLHAIPTRRNAYRSIYVPPNYSRVQISSKEDTKRLYYLLQSYIEDPSRAKAVTEVVIDTTPWIYASTSKLPDHDELPTSMGYEEFGDPPEIRLRRYARRLDLGDKTADQVDKILDWKRREYDFKLQKESEFSIAMIILLFSLCENISTLYLAENLQQPIMDYMLKANYAQMKSPPLQKLKNARFFAGARSDERFYSALEILGYTQLIHRLPALESVAMDAMSDYQADRTFFVPGTGNMKRLEITHCDVSPSFL